jgi:O-antigen ligase
VAAVLVTLCLVCQSLGGVVLTACVLILLFLLRRPLARSNPVRAGAALLVLVLVLAPAAVEAGGGGGVREQVRNLVAGAGKQSLNWRLARSWEHLPQVARRPWLGWGRADWAAANDHTFVNPVNLGLWLLTLGMYGVVGLVSSTLVLTLPVVEAVRWLPRRAWLNPGCSAVTLAAVLLVINAFDSLLNSVYLLPLLAGAGGLNSWSIRRYEGR